MLFIEPGLSISGGLWGRTSGHSIIRRANSDD